MFNCFVGNKYSGLLFVGGTAMPWPKGRHRPKSLGAGRQPGPASEERQLARAKVEVWARGLLESTEVIALWERQLATGVMPVPLVLRLMDYGWGKPVEVVEQVGAPTVLQIVQTRRVFPMRVSAENEEEA